MENQGKKLNTLNLIGLGIGGAVGTGIFVLLGYGIAQTGRSIMLACAASCIIMLLAYWYNLAMPTMFVIKGGDYGMRQMMFNPFMTGISAYMTLVNAFAFAGLTISVTQYVSILFPAVAEYATLFNVIQITLYFLATIRGAKILTIIENYITIILIAALSIFVVFGLPKVDAAAFFANTESAPFFTNGAGGFFAAVALMSWACQGTTTCPVSMAAITKNPKKTIPAAILWVSVILAVVYGLMAYVAAGILPLDQVAGQNISVVAKVILPRPLFLFFVVGGGICAIVTSILCGLGMFRYPGVQMAEDGWLPEVFKKSTKDGYPYVFYLVFYIISVLPLLTGMSLDAIVSLVMIPTMLINIFINYKMVELPKKYPEQWEKRAWRMPVWLWNVISVAGSIFAAVVAYNLFKDLVLKDAIACIVVIAVMIGLTILRIKQGAVSKEKLEAAKQEAIADALLED